MMEGAPLAMSTCGFIVTLILHLGNIWGSEDMLRGELLPHIKWRPVSSEMAGGSDLHKRVVFAWV